MAFQFPANPAMGQLFNPAPGVLYRWGGVGWTPFSTTFQGLQVFANPVLFPDGTLATPGIAWASDIDTGFMKIPGGMQAVVDGVAVFTFAPGAVNAVGPLTVPSLTVTGAANFGGNIVAQHITSRTDVIAQQNASTAGTHYIGTLSVSGSGSLGDGVETYGGAGGVSYANVSGANNNSHRIAFGWRTDGSLGLRVGGSQYGNSWPINITGNSNYANSAGSTPTASNANAVNGISGWSYSNASNNPTWLWGTDGSTGSQFLVHRASMSVNYANTCDRSNSCGTADYAHNAGAVSGVGLGGICRTNGTIYNLSVWNQPEMYNDKFFRIESSHGTFDIRLTNYGMVRETQMPEEISASVLALEARVAALESRL